MLLFFSPGFCVDVTSSVKKSFVPVFLLRGVLTVEFVSEMLRCDHVTESFKVQFPVAFFVFV